MLRRCDICGEPSTLRICPRCRNWIRREGRAAERYKSSPLRSENASYNRLQGTNGQGVDTILDHKAKVSCGPLSNATEDIVPVEQNRTTQNHWKGNTMNTLLLSEWECWLWYAVAQLRNKDVDRKMLADHLEEIACQLSEWGQVNDAR